MINAQILGVNPTALNVVALAVCPLMIVAFLASLFVWSDNLRRRTYSPFHWAGLQNIFMSLGLSLGMAHFGVEILSWSLYAGLIPALLETRWCHRNRDDAEQH